MTQKFFDNFFPKIKIYRTMYFHRGRHWDVGRERAGESASPLINEGACGAAGGETGMRFRHCSQGAETKEDFCNLNRV